MQGSNSHTVIGLARAESSIVVHAEPNFDLKWPVDRDVYMDTSSRRWFEKNVIPPSTRQVLCRGDKRTKLQESVQRQRL